MTQPYPPDEFDRLDDFAARRGAHRARPSLLAAAVPAALVAVVVVAVVVGVTTLLGSRPPQSAATAGFETPTATQTASPTVEPTGTPSSQPTDEPSDEPTDEPTDEPSPQVDRSARIAVLNGTKTSGLAAQAARQLKNDGWNVVRTDNYRDRTVPTTVFYASPDLRTTAEAIAADLGGAHVEQDRAVTDSVTVVLGADYSG